MTQTVTLAGNPITLNGNFPKRARGPAFSLVTKDLADVQPEQLRRQAQDSQHLPQHRHPTCATSVRQLSTPRPAACRIPSCSASPPTCRLPRTASVGPKA